MVCSACVQLAVVRQSQVFCRQGGCIVLEGGVYGGGRRGGARRTVLSSKFTTCYRHAVLKSSLMKPPTCRQTPQETRRTFSLSFHPPESLKTRCVSCQQKGLNTYCSILY